MNVAIFVSYDERRKLQANGVRPVEKEGSRPHSRGEGEAVVHISAQGQYGCSGSYDDERSWLQIREQALPCRHNRI